MFDFLQITKIFCTSRLFVYDTRDIYSNPTKGILLRQSFYSRLDLKKKMATILLECQLVLPKSNKGTNPIRYCWHLDFIKLILDPRI